MTTTDVDAAVEAAVRALEHELETAYYAGDLDALRRITSEDFVFTYGTSDSFPREAWFGRMRKNTPETEARDAEVRERAREQSRDTIPLLTGLRAGEETEYVIEQHGDVVITNRRYNIQDPDRSERCLRYVRVYRQLEGQWRCISHRYIHAVD